MLLVVKESGATIANLTMDLGGGVTYDIVSDVFVA